MLLVENRKARFDYEFLESYLAGMVLSGPEVKSLRHKHGSLTGSYVKILNNEAFLLNAQISPYPSADNRTYDPTRTRKLLLRKHELQNLQEKAAQKGLSLIPEKFELLGRNIKLRFSLARGKKQHQQRSALRERDIRRQLDKESKFNLKHQ